MNTNKNILVVDDEPKILEAVTSFLENKGYTVYMAATGGEALEIFEKKNLSLILLDLILDSNKNCVKITLRMCEGSGSVEKINRTAYYETHRMTTT